MLVPRKLIKNCRHKPKYTLISTNKNICLNGNYNPYFKYNY